MKKKAFAAIPLALAAGAFAQTSRPATTAFQYIYTSGAPGAKVLSVDAMNTSPVTAKPFSAVEERHSVQTLGDGTRIVNDDTNRIYRDAQGRIRIERADGSGSINDPYEGKMYEWSGKDAVVKRLGYKTFAFSKNGTPEAAQLDKLKAETLHMARPDVNVMIRRSTSPGGAISQPLQGKPQDLTDDNLGIQFLNGVNAEGHRTTIRIPAGEIGNDRPMQVVSERWYSDDLQLTVKTTNSDPRFGETTYQMTNIVQAPQDASLFQIPAEASNK